MPIIHWNVNDKSAAKQFTEALLAMAEHLDELTVRIDALGDTIDALRKSLTNPANQPRENVHGR